MTNPAGDDNVVPTSADGDLRSRCDAEWSSTLKECVSHPITNMAVTDINKGDSMT